MYKSNIKNKVKNTLKTFKTSTINSGALFSNIPSQFEPLRKDLWSIEFPITMNIPENFQVTASRPTVKNNSKEVQYKNLTTYYKGKTSVESIDIEFRDVIGPSVYQKLMQWQREHTDFATGKGGYAATYKKTLVLNLEDPTGAVVQKFIYYGCFITSLSGGDLSMEDDGIAMVKMNIQFDSYDGPL